MAFAWFHDPVLAAVFGSALLINLVVAAVVGTTVPLVLNRLGQDPAVSSSVFPTAITDVVGFFAFLGLASLSLAVIGSNRAGSGSRTSQPARLLKEHLGLDHRTAGDVLAALDGSTSALEWARTPDHSTPRWLAPPRWPDFLAGLP